MTVADAPASNLFPAGLVGELHLRDFDEMAATPPAWEQRYWQLGRGQFDGRLMMAHTARAVVGFVRYRPGIMIRGSIPPGTAMVAIPLSSQVATHRGRPLSPGSAAILFSGEETDLRALGPFDLFVFVLERSAMETLCKDILGCSLEDLRRNDQANVCNTRASFRSLAWFEAALRAELQHLPGPLRDERLSRQFEARVAGMVLQMLRPPGDDAPVTARQRLAIRTEVYLHDRMSRSVSIAELCAALRSPARTVHLAFREQFGTTPKAYLKMLRLNAARNELRDGGVDATVTEVAARWGFTHFGWFAHDFRQMFGQAPGEIRRSHEPKRDASLAVFG